LQIRIRFVGFLSRQFGRKATVELEDNLIFAVAVKQISERHSFGPIDIERNGEQGSLVTYLNGRSENPGMKLKEDVDKAMEPLRKHWKVI